MDFIGFYDHNHAHCQNVLHRTLANKCDTDGLRITPMRKIVLDVLSESHHALGAYEIRDRVLAHGVQAKHTVIYRALNFWIKHNLVCKIESLNAFVVCFEENDSHEAAFLICRDCKVIAQNHMFKTTQVKKIASDTRFTIDRFVCEALGQCQNCKDSVSV